MKSVVSNSAREFAAFCAIVMVLGAFPMLLSPSASADPTDSDGDGLSDEDEGLYGSDPESSDSDGDGVSDGYLEFDTSRVLVSDLDSGSIQRTLSMSRTSIEATGEAMQYSVLGYRQDRETEISDYLYWLSPRPAEVELHERYPQLEDQFNKEFDEVSWDFIKVEQSFIPDHAKLSSVDVYLDLDWDGYLQFSICDGNKVPLYQAGYGPTPSQIGLFNFEIEPDLTIIPGHEHWIVIDVLPVSSVVGFYYSTDPFANERGKLIVYTSGGGGDYGWDLTFITHYQHLPELADQAQTFGTEGVSSYFEIAQSFVPTHHHLTSAQVHLFAHSQAQYILEIQEQTTPYPLGQVLTSAILLYPEFHSNPEWLSFDFPDIEVVPGNTYWLVLRSLPPLPIVMPVVNSDGESYPFGELWVDPGTGYFQTLWDLNFAVKYHHVIQLGDQEQTSGGASGGGCPRVGQSFVPDVATLSSVYLHIWSGLDLEVSVEIHEDNGDKPSGVALTSATLNLEPMPSFRWVLFDFQDVQVRLDPETTYWIVFDPGCFANYILNTDPNSYPDGEFRYETNDWEVAPGYDLDFRTNDPKDYPRSVFPIPSAHNLEKERQVHVTYRPVQDYSVEYWTENALGPMKIVVSNEDHFVPYASAFAHRNYGAFVETAEEAEALLRGSQPEYLYYLGTDVILDDLLTHIVPPTVQYLLIDSVDSSENLLTRTFSPDVLDTQELQTTNALSVIHSRDDISLEEERQLWKVAPIYVSLRQTMLVSIECPMEDEEGEEYAVEDADDSITDRIENKIVPLNNGELPEYLVIIGHWKVIPYQKVYGWNNWYRDLAFDTYYSPGLVDQYQYDDDKLFILEYGNPLAQSFMPDEPTLTSVRLRGRRAYPESFDVEVSIVEDDHWMPEGTRLGSSTVTLPYLPGGDCPPDSSGWFEVQFSPSLSLVPGTRYWILVEIESYTWNHGRICGSDFDDAYPRGLLKRFYDQASNVFNGAADHIYADLHYAHGSKYPDMAVGRLMAYDQTAVTLLMNRGPFFDRGRMIKALGASSIGNFDYRDLKPELEALYGSGNVYDWYGPRDGLRGEKFHFFVEILNELQKSEFVEINAHSGQFSQGIIVPDILLGNYLSGDAILGHGRKPPSLHILNGCWTGDYGGETSLVDAYIRVGAVGLIVDADSTIHMEEKSLTNHLYEGLDIGQAYEATLLDSPLSDLYDPLRYYLIGDPMVNYGRFMDSGEEIVDLYPDTDDDGLADKDEIALGTIIDNPDSDGDDLPDGLEVIFHFTDPMVSDTDDDTTPDGDEFDTDIDGLSDGEEYGIHGTDMFDWDTDDDLLSDGEEIDHGLDPLDPYSADPSDTYPDYVMVYSDVALFQESSTYPSAGFAPVRGIDRHDRTSWGLRSDEYYWTYSVTLEYELLIDEIHLISDLANDEDDAVEVWAIVEFPGGQGFVKIAEIAEYAGPDEIIPIDPAVVTNYVELRITRSCSNWWTIYTLEIYGQLES